MTCSVHPKAAAKLAESRAPNSRVVTLTRELVRCPSVTPDPDQTFTVLSTFLRPLGFHIAEKRVENVTNFFATRTFGEGGKHLMFLGHTDVVPPGNTTAWQHPPFEGVIENEILWGRGTADMKGGIAAFCTALERLLDGEHTLNGRVSLLLTSDEEGPAIHGVRAALPWLTNLRDSGFPPDLCLAGEPTGQAHTADTLIIGRRGSLTGSLTLHGTQGHIAYPAQTDNPLTRLHAVLAALRHIGHTPKDDWPWGQLDAGYAPFEPSRLMLTGLTSPFIATNVTPAEATVHFGIRLNPHHTSEALAAKITTVCKDHAGKHTLDFQHHGGPYLTRDETLIELCQKAVQSATGRTPALSAAGGTSDGRFVAAHAPVLELGLREETIHKVDEHVPLKDLIMLEAAYAAILRTFLT